MTEIRLNSAICKHCNFLGNISCKLFLGKYSDIIVTQELKLEEQQMSQSTHAINNVIPDNSLPVCENRRPLDTRRSSVPRQSRLRRLPGSQLALTLTTLLLFIGGANTIAVEAQAFEDTDQSYFLVATNIAEISHPSTDAGRQARSANRATSPLTNRIHCQIHARVTAVLAEDLFAISRINIRTSSETQYIDGTGKDLSANVPIEVRGHINDAGEIVATRISFQSNGHSMLEAQL